MPRHFHTEAVGEKRVKLRTEHFAFRHQSAVLLRQRKEMRHCSRFREHHGFAEQKTALRAADVKRVAKPRNVGERHVVTFRRKTVKEPSPVQIKYRAVTTAAFGNRREFLKAVERAVFRRLRHIDGPGLRHVFPIVVFLPRDKHIFNLLRRQLTVGPRQLHHLVPGRLNGTRFMHGNVSGLGCNDGLPRFEQRTQHHFVRLRTTGKKINFRLRRPAGLTDFGTCRVAYGVSHTVATGFQVVAGFQRFKHLGVRAVQIVAGKVEHLGLPD